MSSSIVIAFRKIEDAKKIRAILTGHGYVVTAVCTTAANALAAVSELDSGILICGYRLADMPYQELAQCLPKYFEMLLLASAGVLHETQPNVLSLELPMRIGDLVNTVNMMLTQLERRRRKDKKKPKPRTWKEQNYISNAKLLLMQRNHLSEDEAYRYIQKCSMDSGNSMAETAQMVLMLMYEEV